MQKEVKIIFMSDTHLGLDYPIRPRIERRRRGHDFFRNFKKVLRYAIRSRADLVIHGGDFFFRSRIPQSIIDESYDILLEFAKFNIPIYIVPGNHERSKLPDINRLTVSNIDIFDRPRTFVLNLDQKVVLSGFPYYKHGIRNQFQQILHQSGWNRRAADLRILCFHHAIEGATVGPSDYTFLHGDDVITVDDLPIECQLILSGHIHRSQMRLIKNKSGEISNVIAFSGSTERTSFAEKDESKGFYQFLVGNNRSSEPIVRDIKFIELPTRPMVDLIIDKDIDKINLNSYLQSAIDKISSEAIVRLKSEGTPGKEVREKLSAAYLRKVFPKSMNVQLSKELFN